MVSEEEIPIKRGGFERHIQTLVTSITLALLMWTGVTLIDLRDRLARMEERLISVKAELLISQENKFSATEWRREKEIIEDRFRRLERDLERNTNGNRR